ncbi:MAG: helix-turn-helix transcriptional regulator [Clostridiales bacterium]|nr:helix-turn-helix transcriptional regulator [Clostridiales bacterium]
MKIGERIKELRIEKALSQAELAKNIGVSQKAVDFWERSVNEPKIGYVMALVDYFDVSFDEFFADIDKPRTDN